MGVVLVTGGAGFIGSNLTKALAASGERVRVLDNLSTGTWDNLDDVRGDHGVELVEADVRNREAVAKACAGVEVVFHEAALGSVPRSVEDPIESDAVNTGGTVCVLDAARHAGVKRVVYAASSSAYGDTPTLPKHEGMSASPLSPYAVSKLAGEHYLSVFARVYGIETLSLRYFNVFGPHQTPDGAYAAAIPKFGAAAIAGKPITVFGDGEQTRDFCYIDNAIQANLLAGSSAKRLTGEVLNIATGHRVTINAVIAEIGRLLGRDLEVVHAEPRAGDVRHSLADVSRAAELLGYQVEVLWKEGVKRTLPWLDELHRKGAS